MQSALTHRPWLELPDSRVSKNLITFAELELLTVTTGIMVVVSVLESILAPPTGSVQRQSYVR